MRPTAQLLFLLLIAIYGVARPLRERRVVSGPGLVLVGDTGPCPCGRTMRFHETELIEYQFRQQRPIWPATWNPSWPRTWS